MFSQLLSRLLLRSRSPWRARGARSSIVIAVYAALSPLFGLPSYASDDPEIIELPDGPVGVDELGPFGDFISPPEWVIHPVYIPRCTPPNGANILDFDTDALGTQPRGSGINAINGNVSVPSGGTITPVNAVRPSLTDIVSFRTPQRHVGLYVGVPSGATGTVALVGYDLSGREVARDALLDVGRSVNHCMAIRTYPNANISRIALEHAGGQIFFDRLFYSDTHDLDAPPRPVAGTVEFITPTDRETLSAARAHLVTGTIHIPSGLTLDHVTISVPRWDRSLTATHIANFVYLRTEGSDDVYWFAKDRVLIPDGVSWIGVTGVGPGVRATAGIEVTGVGAPAFSEADVRGRVDIQPVTIEVTQAIRGPVDLIPPGGAINERSDTVLVRDKPTVVRGFARLTFPDTTPGSAPGIPVNAMLIGTRDGRALPGSPLLPHGTPTTKIYAHSSASSAYHNSKQRTDLSWNFRLPSTWTAQGSIDLALVINTRTLTRSVTEAPGTDRAMNTITLRDVRFRPQQWPSVRIWSVDYWWRCYYRDGVGLLNPGRHPAGPCFRSPGFLRNMQPTDDEIMRAVRGWWNMSPFPGDWPSSFQIFDYTFATAGDPPQPHLEPGSTVDQFLLGSAFRCNLASNHDYSRFNALVSSFVRGCANGVPSVFRATATNDGTVLTHEAGHTMGLRHTASHGAAFAVARWPGDHGEISRSPQTSSAFNVNAMQALPYYLSRPVGANNMRHDVMAYSGSGNSPRARWPSWEVWHHMEDVVGSNLVRIDNRVDDQYYLGAPDENADPMLAVAGVITPNGVGLRPAFYARNAFVGQGDLEAVILDGAGKALTQTKSASFFAWDAENDDVRSFSVSLQNMPSAREFVLYRDGKEIHRQAIEPAPQSIELKAPQKFPTKGKVEIAWRANGGKATHYLLEASRDDNDWFPLATTADESISLNAEHIPFEGGGWQLRVQATSGLSATRSKPLPVVFPVRPLKPRIVNPINGDRLSSNDTIPLRASLPEFAVADPSKLEWVQDGKVIAQGLSGETYIKKPGSHIIELRDPDSKYQTSVNFIIVSDQDADGVADDWEVAYKFDPLDPADSQFDSDQDGLLNWEEYLEKTNPRSRDSDKDGFGDGAERNEGSDPLDATSTPEIQDDQDGQTQPRLDDLLKQNSVPNPLQRKG